LAALGMMTETAAGVTARGFTGKRNAPRLQERQDSKKNERRKRSRYVSLRSLFHGLARGTKRLS
jgi:hypothetical protein